MTKDLKKLLAAEAAAKAGFEAAQAKLAALKERGKVAQADSSAELKQAEKYLRDKLTAQLLGEASEKDVETARRAVETIRRKAAERAEMEDVLEDAIREAEAEMQRLARVYSSASDFFWRQASEEYKAAAAEAAEDLLAKAYAADPTPCPFDRWAAEVFAKAAQKSFRENARPLRDAIRAEVSAG